KILEIVQSHPEIIHDPAQRNIVAEKHGITEKTLRNRIADLKKYGVIEQEGKGGLAEPSTISKTSPNEIDLLYYIGLIWKRRKSLVINVVVVTFFATFISLIMPKTYRASAVLMPPQKSSGVGILNSLTSLPFGSLIPQSTDETMSFISILKSRTVTEEIIHKFNLIDLYKAKNTEETILALSDNVAFVVEDEGTLRISVDVATDWFHSEEQEKKARILSAEMANYFVEQLDVVNKGLKTQQASFQRMFIEGRYTQNIEDLKDAEDRLKTFQQKHKMVALSEQTKVAIEVAATIKGQILANKVKLGVMTTTLNPGHPDIDKIKKETEGLKLQLREMDYGSENYQSDKDNLFPVFSEVPELSVQVMRLKRDVEIQNTLFTFLTQQYEEAKIQEARDTPTVQILDMAISPIEKYKPRRSMLVLSVLILSILLYLIYIYVLGVKGKITRNKL
ncbi:MAG: hypothetical protein ISS11_08160, partial [Candidatus Marinimicrobia bacterium]|nr:hypothetical protein [Candidatus Neomarinimicrobiota bacterium]